MSLLSLIFYTVRGSNGGTKDEGPVFAEYLPVVTYINVGGRGKSFISESKKN